jgi:hypothetical protein
MGAVSFFEFVNRSVARVNGFLGGALKLVDRVLYFFSDGLIMQPPTIDARRDS